MENEIRIPIPEGMEIDRENSTFECIKFKPIETKPIAKKRWRDDVDIIMSGYYINNNAEIYSTNGYNKSYNYHIFATEKQAKSALAMARISQIMANDERFGGVVTDKEWNNNGIEKYVIRREAEHISTYINYSSYLFLAFHTAEQRDLFLKENEDLIRDYLCI